MAELPSTRPSLLVRIRDLQDQQAWREFVQIYGPLVYGFASKRRLKEADAGNHSQEFISAVAGAAGGLNYDPQKGWFRGWLYTVARNKLHDFLLARRRQCQGTGDTKVQTLLEE